MRDHILPEPPGPPAFRVCPTCRRWFALQLERKKPDEIAGKLKTYRCKYCGAEVTYAASHPPHAV
jgi:hypothetical protein